MTSKRYTPIIIGVGDIKNASIKSEDAIEPMQLMVQAAELALKDTALNPLSVQKLRSSIDSVSTVASWTWNYHDLPGLVGEKLGVKPKYRLLSHHGGDSPAKLLDEAARRISFGESKVAVVTGGEALASLSACAAAGKLPPPGWTIPDESATKISLANFPKGSENLGALHSIGLPIHVYPLYENSFRAHRSQSVEENNQESACLYASFAKVASQHPISWNFGLSPASEEAILTVTERNRMICFPYTLLMNAFNNVNLSAACLLTSTEYATELGIPQDRWIYPLAGAGTHDSNDFWERPNYYTSPAISKSLDAAFHVSGLGKDDIDIYDFYSCFPIVPKLASDHLSIPLLSSKKPLTVLGGLTSFGGAGNNYSMHAITEVTRQIRSHTLSKAAPTNALILANGGVLTHQHVIILSSRPSNKPYPSTNPLASEPIPPSPRMAALPAKEQREDAYIETYTVQFSRSGVPEIGFVIGRIRNGERFVANHGDARTLAELSGRIGSGEIVGRWGYAWKESGGDGRNLFTLDKMVEEKL